MTRNLLLAAVLPASIAWQLAAPSTPAWGADMFGGVGGVTRDSASKQPVAEVRITAHNLATGVDRTATSRSDGTFTVEDLKPGRYQVAAARDGFLASVTNVDVAAPGPSRVDFLLTPATQPVLVASAAEPPAAVAPAAGVAPAVAATPAVAAPAAAPTSVAAAPVAATPTSAGPAAAPAAAMVDELESLKKRIEELEAALQTRAAVAPAPAVGAPPPSGGGAPTPAPTTVQPAPAPPAPIIPEALQAPDSTPGVDNFTPFAFGDFTWLNGTSRNKDVVLDTKYFTPEVRFDTYYMLDTNQPVDHSMGGSTEQFRSGEFQLEQISVGGDFHWQNVRGRVLFMDGLFATTTPRNDASAGVGQWNLNTAYRYVSEAWGGYHFNVNHGLNVDAGIFVSYIGLFSYYNFDNWAYQPSYVSSNTPWFFNGLRVQWFPTNKLKIEPWIINGWQSYAKYNGHRGLGGQILYRPHEWLSFVFNDYGNGTDDLGVPGRSRIHADYSTEVRYYNKPNEDKGIDKMAFSLTGDAGCEYGEGVTCHGGSGGPKQDFLGFMVYNRIWWHKDMYAITIGGGKMNNPGRYLTLLPPINGATAVTGSPYFTENPGDKAKMWDSTITFHWMPRQYITWWAETGYRHSDVPYWSGRGGITPPGGNNNDPANYACMSGASSGTNVLTQAYTACGGPGSVWFPDLRRGQFTVSAGVLVKF